MANGIEIDLTVEEKQALKAIGKVIKAVDKLGDESKETGKQVDGAFASFAGNLGAIAASKAFAAITDGILGAVAAAQELEVFETQFKTMLGSTKAAQDQLAELQAFAASTPFQLPGLASSTRQLLSFGVEQEKIIPTLKILGDIASGVGAQIDDLTIPFGRLQASQKLTLVELDKFADRGVNIYKELATQTGTSMANIRDDISKGKIPFDEFNTALANLTNTGGTFFNGMEAQSKTLSGVLSTLSDNFFNLQGTIGKSFSPAVKNAATDLTFVMQDLADLFVKNEKGFQNLASAAATFVGDFAQGATFLLSQITEVDTPLSTVNDEILKLFETAKDLRKERDKFSEGTLFGGLFDGDKKEISRIDLELSKFDDLLFSLEARKKRIIETGTGDFGGTPIDSGEFVGPPEPTGDASSDPRVIKEKDVFDEINAIKAEQALLKEENDLKIKEESGIATEGELEKLRLFEAQKIELKKNSELEKASFIADEKKRLLTVDKINAKAELDTQVANDKASLEQVKLTASAKAAAEKKANDLKIEQEKSFFASATSLANSENKSLAAIGKAAGIIQIAQKTPVAISNAYAFGTGIGGPIVGAVFGGIAGAAMAAQAAQLAGVKGFANGGVIGGFQGSTGGGDNTLATVRTGEMVLSANEQRNLFEGIQSGGFEGGGSNNEMVNKILSQPIIVNVDNKEIARANRTATQEGFAQ